MENKMAEKLFGEIALEENGEITQDDITYALLQQEETKAKGERKLLGQILLEAEKLSHRVIVQILQKQKKTILVCTKCASQYNVINKQSGRGYSCLQCGASLQLPRVAIGTEVSGEIQGDLIRKTSKNKSESLMNLGVSVLAEYAQDGHESSSFEKVARYHILREIARGGMGLIYAAYDTDLKREVAIKFLKDGPFSTQTEKERFVQEFQTAAGVQHPNIIPVYEVGKNAGELYYSMKLIRGETLRQILDGILNKATSYVQQYRKAQLLRIFLSICNGIGFAHSKRVLHRDIKPENVMVGDFGEVVVMDWGLSYAYTQKTKTLHYENRAEFQQLLENFHANLSEHSGEFAGTPHYMSPEQLFGKVEHLDQRSDIFSLGVLLYEILTLQRPCSSPQLAEVLQFHQKGEIVPPHKQNRQVPKALSSICMRALAQNPKDRFRCVQEMVEAIEHAFEKNARFFRRY